MIYIDDDEDVVSFIDFNGFMIDTSAFFYSDVTTKFSIYCITVALMQKGLSNTGNYSHTQTFYKKNAQKLHKKYTHRPSHI